MTNNLYRKKLVTVIAKQWDGVSWGPYLGQSDFYRNDLGALFVVTPEGPLKVNVGDWIVTGVKGEHYLVKSDIFAATYEPEWMHEDPLPHVTDSRESTKRRKLGDILTWWSKEHGDHEGGSPQDCNRCRILALIEVAVGLWDREVIDDA